MRERDFIATSFNKKIIGQWFTKCWTGYNGFAKGSLFIYLVSIFSVIARKEEAFNFQTLTADGWMNKNMAVAYKKMKDNLLLFQNI